MKYNSDYVKCLRFSYCKYGLISGVTTVKPTCRIVLNKKHVNNFGRKPFFKSGHLQDKNRKIILTRPNYLIMRCSGASHQLAIFGIHEKRI